MTPAPVRVGLIGYGLAGRAFHAPVIGAAASVELVRVVSSSPERVRRDLPGMDVVPEVDALLADPTIDLVVVATPNATHAELARRSLRAGKHTVVEKPFVVRSEDADALLAMAADRGLLLATYHNRRWDGDFLTLRALIADGRLGEVMAFESRFDRYRPGIRAGWREEPREGSGVLYDLGSHLVDQALALFGRPETVWADIARQRDGAEVDDYFHVVLTWGRRRAVLHAGTLVRDPGPRFAVHGTEGSFTTWGLDPQEARLRRGAPATAGDGTDEPPWGRLVRGAGDHPGVETVPIRPGRYATFYEEVADAIRGRGANPVPASAGRDVVRVLEAAFLSQREGRRVDVAW